MVTGLLIGFLVGIIVGAFALAALVAPAPRRCPRAGAHRPRAAVRTAACGRSRGCTAPGQRREPRVRHRPARRHRAAHPRAGRDHRQLRKILASPKPRGQWGERMADDVLRLAGLREHVNYRKQKAVEGGSRHPRRHVPPAQGPRALPRRQVPPRRLRSPPPGHLRHRRRRRAHPVPARRAGQGARPGRSPVHRHRPSGPAAGAAVHPQRVDLPVRPRARPRPGRGGASVPRSCSARRSPCSRC